MDKEKFQEIYPHNLRLDCDIQKYSDDDGNLQFEASIPLDGFLLEYLYVILYMRGGTYLL